MRRSEASDCSPWGFQYASASQSSLMRSSEYAESESVVEFCLDDLDEVEDEPEVEIEVEELKGAEKIIEYPEIKAYKLEFEEDDSEDEDWFAELNELSVKDTLEACVGEIEPEELELDLDGLETVSPMDVEVEFDLDKELRESIEGFEDEKEIIKEESEKESDDVYSMTKEEFGKWLDDGLGGLETVSPIKGDAEFDCDEDLEFFEALEEENVAKNGLNCLETVFPNEVIEESVVKEALDVRDKPPDLDELYSQGISNLIVKLISYLSCRKEDESLEKVPMVSCHEKKCKNVCIYFDYFKKFGIFTNTRRWFDAWVKHFYGVFVLNEATIFYDFMCLRNGGDGKK
jgi:hypothetical protein